jgi:hypothetical protein
MNVAINKDQKPGHFWKNKISPLDTILKPEKRGHVRENLDLN